MVGKRLDDISVLLVNPFDVITLGIIFIGIKDKNLWSVWLICVIFLINFYIFN